jgi:hypothetical protein
VRIGRDRGFENGHIILLFDHAEICSRVFFYQPQ